MCGIVGIVTDKNIDRADAALSSLHHRGPDSSGFQRFILPSGQQIYLGHQRLAVIDLSQEAHQPMSNEDGSRWIVYNGEVYNFLELRTELQSQHIFKSHSDTEVLLHLYEERGLKGLTALNGMFAFGLYDSRQRKMILARDRLGVKPLYYYVDQKNFIFASEIKAIQATSLAGKEINWQAIYDYFSYLYIPCPDTAFKGIYQVPPGHYLIYDLDTRLITISPYWDIFKTDSLSRQYSYEDTRELVRQLLCDAVRKQLISDVPLGLFLSGGIDSSVLAGIMAANTAQPLKTFTVLFTGSGIKPYDETTYARRISQKYKTDHHEITVNISDISSLFDVLSYFDQPFANPTCYLSYLISQKTKPYVTVALSGAGGDELFGGYPRYRAIPYARLLSRIPSWCRCLAQRALCFFKEDFNTMMIRRIKLFLRGIGVDFSEQYLRWTYYLSDVQKQRLLTPDFCHRCIDYSSSRIIRRYLDDAALLTSDRQQQVMYVDLKTFLLDNILEYTDKTSMAVGLEVRVPFLDHRLVELCFGMPYGYKIRHGSMKYILKDAFRDMIPSENIKAPKRGFCPPLATWMSHSLDRYFDEYMDRKTVARHGIFNWEYIQQLRAAHKHRIRDNSMELFGIIVFDAWYRRV